MGLKDIVPGIADRLGTRAAPLAADLALADLPALALIPYFCDPSVQFAVHVTPPSKLDKAALKVKFTTLTQLAGGEVAIAIRGDGISPPFLVLGNVTAALAAAVPSGTQLELRTANLGIVNRDRAVAAETSTVAGDQRYRGVVSDGLWRLEVGFPAVAAAQLDEALAIARTVLAKGPWVARDHAEAVATVRAMLDSRSANISEHFVKTTVRIAGAAIRTAPAFDGEPSKHFAIGMAMFWQRFADGPWDVRSVVAGDALGMLGEADKDRVMAAVLG